MEFDFRKISAKDRYKLLMSSIMPRPIALTTTTRNPFLRFKMGAIIRP